MINSRFKIRKYYIFCSLSEICIRDNIKFDRSLGTGPAWDYYQIEQNKDKIPKKTWYKRGYF